MEYSSRGAFKLTVRYGGYFKTVGSVNTHWKYFYGRQKTISIATETYNMSTLHEDIQALFSWGVNDCIKIWYKNRSSSLKVFWPVDTESQLKEALKVYKDMHKCDFYVTVVSATPISIIALQSGQKADSQSARQPFVTQRVNKAAGTQARREVPRDDDVEDEYSGDEYILVDSDEDVEDARADNEDDTQDEDEAASNQSDSDEHYSEDSYHSIYSSDSDHSVSDFEGETFAFDKDNPKIEVGANYEDIHQFRKALHHHAVLNEFNMVMIKSEPSRVTAKCEKSECGWRVHASVAQDGKTFVVKTLKGEHSCPSINKCGNRMATQYWVADRIVEWLRREGDVSPIELRRRIKENFHLDLPYHRIWRGKEIAMDMIHGKWEESYERLNDFMEEIEKRNPGSVTKFIFQEVGEKKHFQRICICLGACSWGFLTGCRPFIGLDGCHLKGKYHGVLVAANALDGNNGMFPLAFGVIESENKDSWTWFLRGLTEAIGQPNGLVLASDRQKGLEEALPAVFPHAEHRHCMRHIYKNFKKKFTGELFERILWTAARSFTLTGFTQAMEELQVSSPEAYNYIVGERLKYWSRHQFGTMAKCHYITNNLSESFNAWISEPRYRPVLNLLDIVRQKIMVKMNQRRSACKNWTGPLVPAVNKYLRKISLGLGEYDVSRSGDCRAEVTGCGSRCEVLLDEKQCTCWRWQVTGLPCAHAAAFIASIRGAKWEDYVDPYFTVEKYKATYSMEIGPMPDRSEWVKKDYGYKLLPPILRRPIGRPKKNRIKDPNEKNKKRHRCKRCGMFGHHAKTCKHTVIETGNIPEGMVRQEGMAGDDGMSTQRSINSSTVRKCGGRPRKEKTNTQTSTSGSSYPVYVPPKVKSRGRPRSKATRREPNQGVDESFVDTSVGQNQAQTYTVETGGRSEDVEIRAYWGMGGDGL